MSFSIQNVRQFLGTFLLSAGHILTGQTSDSVAVPGQAVLFYRSDRKRVRFQDHAGALDDLATAGDISNAVATRTASGAIPQYALTKSHGDAAPNTKATVITTTDAAVAGGAATLVWGVATVAGSDGQSFTQIEQWGKVCTILKDGNALPLGTRVKPSTTVNGACGPAGPNDDNFGVVHVAALAGDATVLVLK